MWPSQPLGTSLFLLNNPWIKGSSLGSQVFVAFCCCQDLVEIPGMDGGVGSSCTRMEPHQAVCSLAGSEALETYLSPWAGES